jgi:hypothetical protein
VDRSLPEVLKTSPPITSTAPDRSSLNDCDPFEPDTPFHARCDPPPTQKKSMDSTLYKYVTMCDIRVARND